VKYLSAEQIAERLNVSAQSVRAWLRTGKLKGVRAGRLWRVLESELEAFLERGQEKRRGGPP
jgi:excisionase family DNA binding protein